MLGEPLYMSGDVAKVAQEKQETYREASPKEGVIREFLEKKIPTDWAQKSVAQYGTMYAGLVLVMLPTLIFVHLCAEAADAGHDGGRLERIR